MTHSSWKSKERTVKIRVYVHMIPKQLDTGFVYHFIGVSINYVTQFLIIFDTWSFSPTFFSTKALVQLLQSPWYPSPKPRPWHYLWTIPRSTDARWLLQLFHKPPLVSSPGGAHCVILDNSWLKSTWLEETSHDSKPRKKW